jgi:hypothetical protein
MIFKQWDYPNVFLGVTKFSVADYGCYDCVLAEINNIFGAACTPADVAAHPWFFDENGQILNSVLATDKGLKNTVFDGAGALDPIKIDQYLADWQNKQMAVKVQLPRGSYHFMKIDQKNIFGQYMCDDPNSGEKVAINHYGPVIGIRYFSKRTPPLP